MAYGQQTTGLHKQTQATILIGHFFSYFMGVFSTLTVVTVVVNNTAVGGSTRLLHERTNAICMAVASGGTG